MQQDRHALLERLYIHEKKSIPQIAEEICVPVSTLQNWLKKSGIPVRSRADGVRLRADVLGLQSVGRKRTMTAEWRANIAKGRKIWGAQNAAGTCVNSKGYLQYTVAPHEGRAVHVVVMEQRLGRRLLDDEQVHHIDQDKLNNDPDNLVLATDAGHQRLHRYYARLSGKGSDNGGEC